MGTASAILFATILSAAILIGPGAIPSAGARDIPIPATVSPEIRAMMAAGPPAWGERRPASVEEWRRLREMLAKRGDPFVRAAAERLGVRIGQGMRRNVPVYTLTPARMSEAGGGCTLLLLHGGGHALNPGLSGALEGVLMAGHGGMTVISPDFRLAPEHPFPASLDDALAVYRDLLEGGIPANRLGVFGSSSGGALTLALMQRIREEGLPMPAAISPGSPWADLPGTGDSRQANAGVDTVLGSQAGWIAAAAEAYAGSADPADPLISPVNMDARGLPPALLVAGTRDLLLSDTVRMHRKLLEAGVRAELIVHEGLSHTQYYFSPNAPETVFHFRQVADFFARHMR